MKKFIEKLSLAAVFAFALTAVPLCVRTTLWQRKAADVYQVPAGTEVLCIGNSHTGCTWSKAPEFGLRIAWRSDRCFLFSVLRLMEFERLGQLDGIKVVIMDCDWTSVHSFTEEKIRHGFRQEFPSFFRYLALTPVSSADIVMDAVAKWHRKWRFFEQRPTDDVPWTGRTAEEKAVHLANAYSPSALKELKTLKNADGLTYELVMRAKAICDRHGIRLVLFASPLVSENPERTQPALYSRSLEALIGRIKALGIDYLDFRAAVSDDQFRDATHLSCEGSYNFTRQFCDTILPQLKKAKEQVDAGNEGNDLHVGTFGHSPVRQPSSTCAFPSQKRGLDRHRNGFFGLLP